MSKLETIPKALSKEVSALHKQVDELNQRCAEAEEALDAIRCGAVDALVIYSDEGEKIYTIQGAETTYRLLIESINEGAATLIEDGTILYCNHRFAEMLSIPLEEVIGTSIHQFIPPEYQPSFSSLLLRGIKEHCRDEIDLLRKGGTHMPVMVSVNNFSAAGAPGVCLIAADLTERKKAEEVIRRDALLAETLSEFSRSLVEASLDEQAILKHTIRSTVQLISDICIIHRLSPDGGSLGVVAHYHPDPAIDLLFEDDSFNASLRVDEALSRQVIQTGEAVLLPFIVPAQTKMIVDSELLALANKIKASSLLVVPIRTHEKTIGTLTLARLSGDQPYDHKDLNLAQRIANQAALAIAKARLYEDLQNVLQHEQTMRLQLIQAEKLSAMSRMMATVVHEINNPVQTIKNCIYLTKMDMPGDSAQQEYLSMASSEIDRISNLVAGLREIYHKPKTATVQLLDLTKILAEVHALLDPHLQHHKVVWQQELSAAPLWVKGTGDHLKQVFLNISMNAIEAMEPAGGTITISASADITNQEVAVAIRDTGPGINPEDFPKLFEPFYTTKEGGSGLGLQICYEIVQQHTGRITVDSQPGCGATFTVWLPMVSPPSN